MSYSQVEHSAFKYREDDEDECPRLLNGLHAIKDHCQSCTNLIRAFKSRPYPVRDHSGRIIVSDFVLIA